MSTPRNRPRRLDALATRLEELLLEAPTNELLAPSRKPGAVDAVRRIIDDQIALAEARFGGGPARVARRHMNLGLLNQSAAAPAQSRARAVFGKDKTSTQQEVDTLLSSLASDLKESKSRKK